MIALSLKDIELGLESPTESFPSIKLHSVAGWEYACLSQKTVEGRFLKAKLLKKLEIFFIPDHATVNVHEKTPILRTWWGKSTIKTHHQYSNKIQTNLVFQYSWCKQVLSYCLDLHNHM